MQFTTIMNGDQKDSRDVQNECVSTTVATTSTHLSTSAPSVKTNWKELERIAKEVKGFFNSLNAVQIGTGLMMYNKEFFVLHPRSNWLNNHTYQWIMTIGDKTATFEAVQGAFTALHLKIKYLARQIELFKPDQQEQFDQAEKFLISLIRIQLVIDGISRAGVAQLSQNYSSAWKYSKSASILSLGTDAFELVLKIKKTLIEKLIPFIPDLEVTIALETYSFSAKELLTNRDDYRENLRSVSCNIFNGLILPPKLVEDSLKDSTFTAKPNKDALRIAANYICLPSRALAIPTQNGVTLWVPLRLIKGDRDQIVSESGVNGTCERDGNGSDNLCNLYYRIIPDEKFITISSGAINTPLKAAQLAYAMKETLQLVPEANERWIVHQLNSCHKEEKLIRDVHTHVALNEPYFQKTLENKNLSLLHINTCFNAATLFSREDLQSLRMVNIDSLAKIGGFVWSDISHLLKENPILSSLVDSERNSFKDQSAIAMQLACDIKQIKLQIKQKDATGQLDQIALIENQIDTLRGDLSIELTHEKTADFFALPETAAANLFFSNSDEEPVRSSTRKAKEEEGYSPCISRQDFAEYAFKAIQGSEDASVKVEELQTKKQKLVAALPASIKELKEQLIIKQANLEKHLQEVRESIQSALCILKEEQLNDKSALINQSLLILQVFEQILIAQLKLPNAKPLSRCCEIELFLLLYRLLEIKPIIICWSGLDRSGGVRAMADAQMQWERECFKEIKHSKSIQNQQSEFESRIEASQKMFELILNMDAYRQELFVLTNSILAQKDLNLTWIDDLKTLEKTASSIYVRNYLFKKIDEKYEGEAKAQKLKDAYYYLELVGKQLLGTEAEKTLFSSGVVGFKYHHDAYWPKSYFANPHPLERLPPFIYTGTHNIRLLNYSEGWVYNSLTITPAGMAIFLRLSILRGN